MRSARVVIGTPRVPGWGYIGVYIYIYIYTIYIYIGGVYRSHVGLRV